jgi:hypothetical protein
MEIFISEAMRLELGQHSSHSCLHFSETRLFNLWPSSDAQGVLARPARVDGNDLVAVVSTIFVSHIVLQPVCAANHKKPWLNPRMVGATYAACFIDLMKSLQRPARMMFDWQAALIFKFSADFMIAFGSWHPNGE